MNNILVTGANGQLGSELRILAQKYPAYNFHFTDYKALDITNHTTVDAFVKSAHISVIINCATHTAVDKAESDLKMSTKLNHLAVKNFARIAKAKTFN